MTYITVPSCIDAKWLPVVVTIVVPTPKLRYSLLNWGIWTLLTVRIGWVNRFITTELKCDVPAWDEDVVVIKEVVSQAALKEAKASILSAFDENKDGKIDIAESRGSKEVDVSSSYPRSERSAFTAGLNIGDVGQVLGSFTEIGPRAMSVCVSNEMCFMWERNTRLFERLMFSYY
ncbi:hypothetical protein Btru_031117 [Bulinus truncatus]|nr:hypothetical protein Btru_031117 [Bulinus truncatus]